MKVPTKAPLKLMLLKDIKGLGDLGDVVKVRAGYARNYLLPRGLATKPSDDTTKRVDAIRKKAAAEAQKNAEQAKAAAAALANVSIHIESKAGEGGHLYGSVTQAMISDALKKQGYAIETDSVVLAAPIKELGIYDIALKLVGDVEAKVKLYVVSPAPEKPAKSEKSATATTPIETPKRAKSKSHKPPLK
jgi:large subunit ribosomal protein L9